MQPEIRPARVTVAFTDGTVTLLPRRAPVGHSGPIRGTTLTALPLGPDEPATLLDRIRALVGRQPPHAPATLDLAPEGTGPSLALPGLALPGLALLGLTANEATALGSRLGLSAVFFWDGRRGAVLDCPPANTEATRPEPRP